jgi:hypothetical protein
MLAVIVTNTRSSALSPSGTKRRRVCQSAGEGALPRVGEHELVRELRIDLIE